MEAMTAVWKKMYHNAHGHSKQHQDIKLVSQSLNRKESVTLSVNRSLSL